MSSSLQRLRRVCAALMSHAVCGVVLCALAGGGSVMAGEVSKEYQVKAAFLYNFTKFVEWPASRFASDTTPITIAVIGENPFGNELQAIVHGRKVNGREIVIVATPSLDEAKRAHLVFVCAAAEKAVESRLGELHTAGVVTVGESPRFGARGGVITFVVTDDKVHFEINVASAERGGVKISAQLQKLATVVRTKPGSP